ncbi:NAD(P)H-binding protein [Modestobacter sp. VKM Ac-2979]|uniref:NAD(P)H-binding protein n=1 Tax=unclassified Modestobacter TaxID=2643866 RepID=UPI0022AB6A94|nr:MULTISPECIES: NAD(P)H-binding protein [unclassified Modestobacter]MCZ2810314.1 NAD(P)H-binding protein [Modestobacter sp. VKM Ac-2979]MCZ2841800.1 NAD(P)H-binding protein [Modestobacter sp. VKM Ac-2980]
MTEQLILVTGGTGTTGRRIAHRLRARGVPVRVASRSAACRLDWADPTTWDAALAGASAVYLAYAPDLAVPGADDVLAAFTDRAARAGVGRVVLLSGRGEPAAQRAEQAVRETASSAGLDWTVVRCSWFVQNFTEGQFADAVRTGELALPVDDVVEPFVDADDIADVAVAALLDDGHAGLTHELTGPRALTFAAAVAELAAATGRPVAFRSVPLAEFTAALAGEGAPPEVVELMTHLFTEVLDGRNAAPTGGVQQALGRPATDVTDAVRRSALAGSRA